MNPFAIADRAVRLLRQLGEAETMPSNEWACLASLALDDPRTLGKLAQAASMQRDNECWCRLMSGTS
jgi:hypothetical protein